MIIDHSLRWIVPFVIASHLIALLFLQEFSKELPPLPSRKMIAVKTVKLFPKTETKMPAKVEKEIKPQPQPKPAKEVKKTKVPPKAPVSKPAKVNERKNELVALAKEKIGKIGSSSDKILKSSLEGINTPKTIEHFQSELSFTDVGGDFTAKELAYRDELATRLRLHLKLPEYGDVKIELKVERSGKIGHFKILSYQSTLNAEYIKKNLPKVTLPSFKEAESYDFTIVMRNE